MRRLASLRGREGFRYGSWWCIHYALDRTFALGIYVQPWQGMTGSGLPYGPYIDVHLPMLILSVGVNPVYANDPEFIARYGRAGLRARDS